MSDKRLTDASPGGGPASHGVVLPNTAYMTQKSGSAVASAVAAAATHMESFADLLEDDPNWRNKLLKNLQYSCRVASVFIAAQDAATAQRLKATGSALSLARRVMIVGEVVGDVRELVSLLRAGTSLLSWDVAASSTAVVNDVFDDWCLFGKIKLLPDAWMPEWVERAGDVAWTVNTTVVLVWTLVRLRSTKDPFKRVLLVVSAVKYLADLGQALPAALDVDVPPLFDYLCGLSSGLLSTYKIWAKHSHALRKAAA